jgi:hypothetical protein
MWKIQPEMGTKSITSGMKYSIQNSRFWCPVTPHVSLSELRMSKKGRTIIFSINQPQYSIFKFFDSLTLVASGKVMFHGPAQDALEYFRSAGMAVYCYESFFIHRICKEYRGYQGCCLTLVQT